MLHERLRNETKLEHQRIEAELNLQKITSSPHSYFTFLKKLYGFYIPVEDKLLTFEGQFAELGLPCKERLKRDLLVQDLKLGEAIITGIGESFCSELPPMSTVHEALGVFYVLEGSTLGGQVIYQSLQKNCDFPRKDELRFHLGYGPRTGLMWQKFKAVLEAVPQKFEGEVVKAANSTFINLRNWMAHG